VTPVARHGNRHGGGRETTCVDLADLDLARAGGGRVTAVDLRGRPWIAYLARHPG
jgi:hypothetical protein